MRPTGLDPKHDLCLLDPRRHRPLEEQATAIRDAYTERERAKAALKNAEDDLYASVHAYAAERLKIFRQLLCERGLGCCLRCEDVVSADGLGWLRIEHVYVTDEGYDATVHQTLMVRACEACLLDPGSVWIHDNLLRERRTPARKRDDETFETQTWIGDPPEIGWNPFDMAATRTRLQEEPHQVPRKLPAELASALPPMIDIRPATKELWGHDPEYSGVRRGALVLITDDLTELL